VSTKTDDLIYQTEGRQTMSRIGRKPVPVPTTVKVAIADSTIQVEGPKGKLSFKYRPEIDVKFDQPAAQILVSRADDERVNRSLHGLTRSLVANMVQGVTSGYIKKLEIVGVGYQAQLKKANTLALQVGYANQVVLEAPTGVGVAVPDPTHITISGADKQAVGQFAAVVRKVRPPEPYKGKGIRYEGEFVRRKAGKAFGSK
jgi:large subunit ribosomal protein L6